MAGSEYGNNYRDREPVQYSVGMVEHLDSREILEAYRDPDVQPAEDVGCQGGRRDIWNRSWEKLALEGRPGHLEHGPSSINEDRLYTGQYGESHPRAMDFALDLSMKASVEAQKDFLEIQQALHPERALARWEDLKRRAPDAFGKDWDPAEMAARKESARPQFSMSEIIDTMGEGLRPPDPGRCPEPALAKAGGGWRLDRAAQGAGGPPGAQHVGVVDAVATSQRRRNQGHHLVARVRPARGAAKVEMVVDQLGQAQAPGQGGRKDQTGIGHQAVIVEGDLDAVGMVRW